MTHLPMFSKLDTDQILRRAVEIEGSDDAAPITIAEIQQASSAVARRHSVQKFGLVVT
jgi:hypothetical protein